MESGRELNQKCGMRSSIRDATNKKDGSNKTMRLEESEQQRMILIPRK